MNSAGVLRGFDWKLKRAEGSRKTRSKFRKRWWLVICYTRFSDEPNSISLHVFRASRYITNQFVYDMRVSAHPDRIVVNVDVWVKQKLPSW